MSRSVASFLLALVAGAALVTSGVRAAGAGEGDPGLPRALAGNGFGDARQALKVEFLGPIGEDADHPRLADGSVAPAGTLWVFRDPKPVLAILAKAQTRSYQDGMFPGAIARLRIDASTKDVRRVIHFHYRPGQGDVSVRRGQGRFGGGAWSFDPRADRALVALLTKTPPTALGAPALKVFQLRRKQAQAGAVPRVWSVEAPHQYAAIHEQLAFRYPRTGRWKLPKGFDWATHRLVAVELPQGMTGKRLDWSEARLRDGVLSWRVRAVAEDMDEHKATGGSTVMAALPRGTKVAHLRAVFDDGTQVETRTPMNDIWHVPRRPDVFVRITERGYSKRAKGGVGGWIDHDTIEVHFDGRYTRTLKSGARHHGRLDPRLTDRLVTGFGADATKASSPIEHRHFVDDYRTKKPDGLMDLLTYIARAHDTRTE